MSLTLAERSAQYDAAINGGYSLRRVLQGVREDTLEAEVSRQIQRDSGLNPSGTFVPLNKLYQTRAGDLSTSGGNASGGYLVEGKLRETVDVLRPFAACIAAGATVLDLTDAPAPNVVIPRIATGTGPFLLPETSGSYSTTSGAMTFSSVTLSPHRIASEIHISKQLVKQAQFSVTELVTRTMLKDIGSTIDYAAINGTGSNSYPTGLLSFSEDTSDPSKLSAGTTFGGAPTWAGLVGMVETVLSKGAINDGTMNWIISPLTFSAWMTTLREPGSSFFLMQDDHTVVGYPSFITSNLASTNQCVFGRMSDLIIVLFYLDICVDPFTLAGANQLNIMINVGIDVGLLQGQAIVRSEDNASV
jgi:HK97 family phage major capsid protein